jgi:hypothetical protein
MYKPMKKFHTEIYFPFTAQEIVNFIDGIKHMDTTGIHANDRADTKNVRIPSREECLCGEFFEVKTDEDGMREVAIRFNHDKWNDGVVVIRREGIYGTVKTVWKNDKNDKHGTLRVGGYEPKP